MISSEGGDADVVLVGYPSHAMTSRLHARLLSEGSRCLLLPPDELVTTVVDGRVTVLPMGAHRPAALVLTTSTDHLPAVHSAAQLERSGVPVLNRPAAALLAADKVQTAVALAHAGVPVPRTVAVSGVESALAQAELIGYPLVLKAADGAEGDQVRRVPSADQLPAVLWELRVAMGQSPDSRSPVLLQELLVRALGRDRRLFLVGGTVQAAMDRAARPGEWRSNLSQGAQPLPAEATPEEIDIAERAAAALGLDFTTIDLMLGERGPVVVEANPYGDVLDVAVTSGLDLVGSLAQLITRRAGSRPTGVIRPQALTTAEHAELTAFCRQRWQDKRHELDLLDPAPARA